jgi:hypothetical protein
MSCISENAHDAIPLNAGAGSEKERPIHCDYSEEEAQRLYVLGITLVGGGPERRLEGLLRSRSIKVGGEELVAEFPVWVVVGG